MNAEDGEAVIKDPVVQQVKVRRFIHPSRMPRHHWNCKCVVVKLTPEKRKALKL